MIVVNKFGQCSDMHGNYVGNLNFCWQCQSQLVPLPGNFVYYWLNTPTAPQSVSSYIDVTSASDQVSVETNCTRYGYNTSPLNSLYVADKFSESSVYIRNDGKTFLFCHPLGKILLMLNGRLQASFNTSFGQKR